MKARNILVADEDKDTRIILRTVLERNAYEIVEASTTEDAIAAAQRTEFDLIILNYPMADGGGRALVRLVRSGADTCNTPILNLTSRVVPQFLQDAAADGVDVTIAKPMDVEHVVQVVNELTGRHSLMAH